MTDEHEDALRRALHEVAGSTGAAAGEPPPLDARVVPLAPRRRDPRHIVLAAVAAAVVVVAGVVAVVAGSADDKDVDLATDDSTTTTESTTSSTSASTVTTSATQPTSTVTTEVAPGTGSTTSTTFAPEGDRAELAAGDGWTVVRLDGTDGSCVGVIRLDDGRVTEWCGLADPGEEVGTVVVAPTAGNGRVVLLQVGSAVDTVEDSAPGYGTGLVVPFVADPLQPGWRWAVTDEPSALFTVRSGDEILAAVYGEEVVDVAPAPGYRRASGSLSMGEYLEIGAYRRAEWTCVVAHRLTPSYERAADLCPETGLGAVLVPTSDPMLLDPFGIAPLSAATEWACTLPSGASCGTGNATAVPELGATVLSWYGPISVDDGGERADHVTFTVDGQSFDVAVPAT